MKKNIIIVSAIALSCFATSCRKERTCECKTTTTEVRSGFGSGTYINTSSSKITKEKQHKGSFVYASSCFSETSGYNDSGGGGGTAWTSVVTVEKMCELK